MPAPYLFPDRSQRRQPKNPAVDPCELDLLLDELTKRGLPGETSKAVIVLASGTGARPASLLALRWGQLTKSGAKAGAGEQGDAS